MSRLLDLVGLACTGIVVTGVAVVGFAFYAHHQREVERKASELAADSERMAERDAEARAREEYIRPRAWRAMTWLKAAGGRMAEMRIDSIPKTDAILGDVDCKFGSIGNQEVCRNTDKSDGMVFFAKTMPSASQLWSVVNLRPGDRLRCDDLGLRTQWSYLDEGDSFTGCAGLPGQVVIRQSNHAVIAWYSPSYLDEVEPGLRAEWAAHLER